MREPTTGFVGFTGLSPRRPPNLKSRTKVQNGREYNTYNKYMSKKGFDEKLNGMKKSFVIGRV